MYLVFFFLKKKDSFLFSKLYVCAHVSVWICAYVSPEEDVRAPATGDAGGCKLSDMGAGDSGRTASDLNH